MNDTTAATSEFIGGGTQALTPEAAQQKIKGYINDPDFRGRLLNKDPVATAEWSGLHAAGFPVPKLETVDDVATQEQNRTAETMNARIATLLKVADLTPAMQEEVRRQQPVAADEQKFAREEIERMKRDKDFVRKLLDGNREANTAWTRMHLITRLPTASTKTTYPVK